eukprot:TRINITY_DN1540_c0_g1_i6.p4 TRINITY_DN1540_c0_g1~~TRINITY_DN1540_c0_g1_i6.p4  ORF type:complete len:119 (-),score=66.25 TRINITY_DN1540_c0_g1_i6:62-418(-)
MRVDAEQKARVKADKARKAAEATNAELRGKLTGLEKARLSVDNQIKRLESDLAKAKVRCEDEEKARSELATQVKKKEGELSSKDDEIAALTKRNQILSRKMAAFMDMISSETPKVDDE